MEEHNEAIAALDSANAEKQERLDRVASMEARYIDAMEQEEVEKQLEKEQVDEDVARRAILPKQVKEPSLIWKPFMESMVTGSMNAPEEAESCFLPATMPRLAPGTFLQRRIWALC